MKEIRYPVKLSEADIQALLWQRLREAGFDARLEVRGILGNRRTKMDIVVFRNKLPLAIIECKSWTRRYSKEFWYQKMRNSKQLNKYREFGVPVSICGREESIPQILNFVQSL